MMILIEYASHNTRAQQCFARPDENTSAFLRSMNARWMLSSDKSAPKAQDMYFIEDDILESVASNIRAFGDAGDITNVEIIHPRPRSLDANGGNDIRYRYNISE